MTETEGGLDIVLEGVRPSPAALGAFAGKAASLGVARLTARRREHRARSPRPRSICPAPK